MVIEDLTLHKGEAVEVILLQKPSHLPTGTIGDLLNSEAVGMWADREDIEDSVEYAQRIRRDLEDNLRGR